MKKDNVKNYLKYHETKSLMALDYIYTLHTKGDYIECALNIDGRIKSIDSAIPSEVSKNLLSFNINSNNFVTIYFKNGTVEYTNILEYVTILIKGL